jgi:hypothetical protein
MKATTTPPPAPRKVFVEPRLERHETVPVITGFTF